VCLLELALDIEAWKTFARCSLPIGRATPTGMFSKLSSVPADRRGGQGAVVATRECDCHATALRYVRPKSIGQVHSKFVYLGRGGDENGFMGFQSQIPESRQVSAKVIRSEPRNDCGDECGQHCNDKIIHRMLRCSRCTPSWQRPVCRRARTDRVPGIMKTGEFSTLSPTVLDRLQQMKLLEQGK
jgi:hypothetical protein